MLTIKIIGSSFFVDQIKNRLQNNSKFVYVMEVKDADIVINEGRFENTYDNKINVSIEDGLVHLYTDSEEVTYPSVSLNTVLETVIAMAHTFNNQKEKIEFLEASAKEYKEESDENELNQHSCRDVQLKVMASACNLSNFESELIFVPKAQVSGDFIMVQELYDKVFIFFGDVTGHGSYGGTYGAVLTSLARGFLLNASPMQANIISFANYMKEAAFIYHGGCPLSSAEDVVCEIDLKKNTASFVTFGGGTITPIIIRPNGKLVKVFNENTEDGVILPRMGDSIYEDIDFEVSSTKIEGFTSGNSILFYTDGITELFSSKKNGKDFAYTYGPENMMKTITNALKMGETSPSDIVKAITSDVISYGIQGLENETTLSDVISDDATIFCIRRK